MIIATIGPLSIATVWRQFHLIDDAVSPSPLFSSHAAEVFPECRQP